MMSAGGSAVNPVYRHRPSWLRYARSESSFRNAPTPNTSAHTWGPARPCPRRWTSARASTSSAMAATGPIVSRIAMSQAMPCCRSKYPMKKVARSLSRPALVSRNGGGPGRISAPAVGKRGVWTNSPAALITPATRAVRAQACTPSAVLFSSTATEASPARCRLPDLTTAADQRAPDRRRVHRGRTRLSSTSDTAETGHHRDSDGGRDARQDGLPELLGPGELRPVPRGQVDVVDVADLSEAPPRRMALCHPLPERRARELAHDDRDGHVVPALVEELLRVARDVHRRRDRALTEGRTP